MTPGDKLRYLKSLGFVPRLGGYIEGSKITIRLVKAFLKLVKFNKKDKCWLWKGQGVDNGYGKYGRFKVKRKVKKRKSKNKMMMATKFIYEAFKAEVKPGNIIRHKICDNPPCVNLFHLKQGSQKQNVKDCIDKGRRAIFHGIEHGMAKLTELQVKTIRRKYESGTDYIASLARYYKVGASNIRFIVTYQTWKHV